MVSKATLKFVHSLKQKKYRIQNNAFVAEGDKLVPELLHSRIEILTLFATPRGMERFGGLFAKSKAEIVEVNEKEMARLSFLKTPRDLLAVCRIPDDRKIVPEKGTWSLYLDDIRDPGNLGTIIRTADWFGLKSVFCSPTTADPYNPKVVQATMGSIARVAPVFLDFKNLPPDLPAYAAMMEGLNVKELKEKIPGVIVIGNEGHGISPDIAKRSTAFTIPGKGAAESLNASVATGIALAFVRI